MNYSWYTDKNNRIDSVHQILAFGKLDDILGLKKEIGEETLREIFITHPKKVYTMSALNFIEKFILELKTQIDDKQYIKNTLRNIRQ